MIPSLQLLHKHAHALDPWFNNQGNLTELTPHTGLWQKGALIVIPDAVEFHANLLCEVHTTQVAGHLSVCKTRVAVSKRYSWPPVAFGCRSVCQGVCCLPRNKTNTYIPAGLLTPLWIPDILWESMSMDFITQLPKTRRGHDAISVLVDCRI